MKKKIAIIFEGDIFNPRGEFLAIHNRVKEYVRQGEYIVTPIIYWPQSGVQPLFAGGQKNKYPQEIVLDGISYMCRWYNKSLIDYVFRKLTGREFKLESKQMVSLEDLSVYDLIYANSLRTGLVADYYHRRCHVPFVMGWHGSTIHTLPFICHAWHEQVSGLLKNANYNFFVSQELLETSLRISKNKGCVSLNGIDESRFYKYSTEERITASKSLNIDISKKNVAFVGNLIPVKNAEFLPFLFSSIKEKIPNSDFYVVGTGNFQGYFGEKTFVKWINNLNNEKMPDMYNCMNLIVMPSRNEGLPMTCLEAKACGTPFVGSRVGGIAEVVGIENTILRDNMFDQCFIDKCIEVLLNRENNRELSLDEKYSLSIIVTKETSVINHILQNI